MLTHVIEQPGQRCQLPLPLEELRRGLTRYQRGHHASCMVIQGGRPRKFLLLACSEGSRQNPSALQVPIDVVPVDLETPEHVIDRSKQRPRAYPLWGYVDLRSKPIDELVSRPRTVGRWAAPNAPEFPGPPPGAPPTRPPRPPRRARGSYEPPRQESRDRSYAP